MTPKEGTIFVTPSGRRWRLSDKEWMGRRLLTPLGPDTFGFGGVKGRYVDPVRLDGTDKTWKRVR